MNIAYPILLYDYEVTHLSCRGKVEASTDESEGIVYGDIDLTEVDKVRSQIPVTSQRRWDLYSITDKTQD